MVFPVLVYAINTSVMFHWYSPGAGERDIVSYSKDPKYNFGLILTPGVFVLQRPIYDKTFEFSTI